MKEKLLELKLMKKLRILNYHKPNYNEIEELMRQIPNLISINATMKTENCSNENGFWEIKTNRLNLVQKEIWR